MRAVDRELKAGRLGAYTRGLVLVWQHGHWRDYLRGTGRMPPWTGIHASINGRGALEERLRQLDPVAVLLVRSGHDCDCTSYVYRTKIVNPLAYGLFVWQRMEDEHRESLDGPEYTSFEAVGSLREGHWSRDCAMEAYEDGHPGSVTISDPEGAWE